MYSKKILILPVTLSLISHALFISATGIFDTSSAWKKPETTITVNLPSKAREEIKRQDNIVKANSPATREAITNLAEETEETVSLDSRDERFTPYLAKIKQKVGAIWSYPPQAFAQRNEGTSTVEFALNSRGALVENRIVTTSGYEVLDRETIKVIRAAAPYEPFPRDFKFSRLRILASFQYRFRK